MSSLSFQDWLLKNGKQSLTIHRHLINLAPLKSKLKNWNVDEIDAFIVDLKKQGRKNATINSYIDTIRLYATWANLGEELKNYKHLPKEESVKTTFTDSEVEAFLNLECPLLCNKRVWELDRLFWSLVAYTGARPGEIANIKVGDLNFQTNIIIIPKSKTGKPRNIPIPRPVRNALFEYVNSIKTDYVFLTNTGKVYSDFNWLHSFKKRIKILGIIRRNLTPYSFRHSMATSLLQQDVNIYKVAKLLGHRVEQTFTYEHLVTKDIENALNKHPLIRKSLSSIETLNAIKEFVHSLNDSRLKVDEGNDYIKIRV